MIQVRKFYSPEKLSVNAENVKNIFLMQINLKRSLVSLVWTGFTNFPKLLFIKKMAFATKIIIHFVVIK